MPLLFPARSPLGQQSPASTIARSLRFNHLDSATIARTPSVTGERRAFTYSAWIKRPVLANSSTSSHFAFSAYIDNQNYTLVYFHNIALDTFSAMHLVGGVVRIHRRSAAMLRDPTAWCHLVVNMSTLPATPTCEMWANGVLLSPSIVNTTIAVQNDLLWTNASGVANWIGSLTSNGGFSSFYMADVYFIDGQALPASEFGVADPETGEWMPIKYNGAFGTNGCWLSFANNASTMTLCMDDAGGAAGAGTGANDWSPSNLSIAAGRDNDSLTDTPTNYGTENGIGGEVRGNFCTLNLHDAHSSTLLALRNGNMEAHSVTVGAWTTVRGTMRVRTGKWYWEGTFLGGADGLAMIGVMGHREWLAGRTDSFHLGIPVDGYAYYNYASGGAALQTYILSCENSGLTGGTYNKKLVLSGADATDLAIPNVTAASPHRIYASTPAGTPGTSYSNGVITAEVNMKSADGNFGVSVRAHRANSAGAFQTSGTVSTEQFASFGVLSFSLPSESLGTWAAGDRLIIEYIFRNVGGGSISANLGMGTSNSEAAFYTGGTTSGQKYNSNVGANYGLPFGNGDVIGVAYDGDTGAIAFFKNGVALGTAYTATFVPTSIFAPAVSCYQQTASGSSWIMNFGQRPFAYSAPAGYKSLCSHNIPDPLIKRGSDAFSAHSRVGTGAAYNVTGKRFSPGMVWIKSRSAGTQHRLYDNQRGAQKLLVPNEPFTENPQTGAVSSFNADGYSSVGTTTGENAVGVTFIDWLIKRGTGLMDIVPYTGNGAGRTIAHGLGATPALMLIKASTNATGWIVWHQAVGHATALQFDENYPRIAPMTYFNGTDPTLSVFSVGPDAVVNANGVTFVAYLFAEVPGFSRFAYYPATTLADGPFVWCGFRPQWLLIKSLYYAQSWQMIDATRSPINPATALLVGDTPALEAVGPEIDFFSNGFKVRSTDAAVNGPSGDYSMFAAFGESPFKYARARI